MEIADQTYYPAIIKGFKIDSKLFPIETFSYKIAVDYGDGTDNERILVDIEVLENFLYPFTKFNQLK